MPSRSSHDDERLTYRGHPGKLTFVAFYADCHHQVRPVSAGHRIALTYNLMIEGDTPTVAWSAQAAQVDALPAASNATSRHLGLHVGVMTHVGSRPIVCGMRGDN